MALLDLGSNAARFLLVKIRPGKGYEILDERRIQTRLGGDRHGRLPGPAVRKTLRAAHAFLEPVRRRNATRVIALATAAVRDADNADSLLIPLRPRGLGERGDDVLALKLAQLGLVRYPSSATLAALRLRALDAMRLRHQQLSPFKFIIYSEWAGAELSPVE